MQDYHQLDIWNRAMDYAVSVYQSGFPLQITQSTNNNSVFGYASQRPSATGTSTTSRVVPAMLVTIARSSPAR